MNENNTTQWLRYLLYVGIAAMVNSLLGTFLLSGLSKWVGYGLNAAALYLLFRLISCNARYKTAVLFSGATLIIGALGIQKLSLAGSICGIVGVYQEFHAHSELIADRNPRLAVQWSNLFFIQLGVSILLAVMSVLSVGLFIGAAELNTVVITAIITVVTAVISMILKVLYLVYLKRTIQLLETEAVVE